MEKKEDKVTTEDRATIDFVGTIDGEEFEGSKATNFLLVVGHGQMAPDFEDSIIGRKAGEEFIVDIKLSRDYYAENLQGKYAKFSVTLKKVEEYELPGLTEELIKHFGVEDGSVVSLRAEVRKNMERALKSAVFNYVKTQVIDGLVRISKVDTPSTLVKGEMDMLHRQIIQRLGSNKQRTLELPHELLEEKARYRVAIGLLLREIIRINNLRVDEEYVKTMIEEIALSYKDPQNFIKLYNTEKEMMKII